MIGVGFVVVGIGADGWAGLTDAARAELSGAQVIYGARRQLDLLEDVAARLVPWASPMSVHLARVLDTPGSDVVHVLASGDPMVHGVGTSIVNAVGKDRVRIVPAVSSVSLAGARLGWDLTRVRVISAVTSDADAIIPELTDGARILVLSRDDSTPAVVAEVLTDRGFGWSSMTVLEQLGGPRERMISALARGWDHRPGTIDPLNIVAVDCIGPRRTRLPGLPDDEFNHDGQITKSSVRALTVTALRPGGRQLLWDIGSGSGSIAIDWLRADDRGMAVCFERDATRAKRIVANAARHGVRSALSVRGAVPESLSAAPDPDVVFIGGGLDVDILDRTWEALPTGGRLVANAVTLESERILIDGHTRWGGTLRRIGIESAEPLGSMTTWRPALAIVQWVVDKP